MSEFCPMITQCGWCNPYCSERVKLETLRNLEKDWWGYGKDSGNTIQEHPTIIPAEEGE